MTATDQPITRYGYRLNCSTYTAKPVATCSVSVFEWLPSGGGGIKRGRTIKRFRGAIDNPNAVVQRALDFIDRMDELDGNAIFPQPRTMQRWPGSPM